MVDFETRLLRANNVRFHQGDVLTLRVGSPQVPRQYFDVVVMSTLCYQMLDSLERLLAVGAKLLKPTGFILIQDFARKHPHEPGSLDFTVNWFRDPFSYQSFLIGPATKWEMKEVLQWQNGRCEAVRPGEDFSFLHSALPGQLAT